MNKGWCTKANICAESIVPGKKKKGRQEQVDQIIKKICVVWSIKLRTSISTYPSFFSVAAGGGFLMLQIITFTYASYDLLRTGVESPPRGFQKWCCFENQIVFV